MRFKTAIDLLDGADKLREIHAKLQAIAPGEQVRVAIPGHLYAPTTLTRVALVTAPVLLSALQIAGAVALGVAGAAIVWRITVGW